jgi:hypothetical protein
VSAFINIRGDSQLVLLLSELHRAWESDKQEITYNNETLPIVQDDGQQKVSLPISLPATLAVNRRTGRPHSSWQVTLREMFFSVGRRDDGFDITSNPSIGGMVKPKGAELNVFGFNEGSHQDGFYHAMMRIVQKGLAAPEDIMSPEEIEHCKREKYLSPEGVVLRVPMADKRTYRQPAATAAQVAKPAKNLKERLEAILNR